MNDPIKYLITGAAIALICATVGVTGGVWLMKEMGNSQPAPTWTANGKPASINFQSPAINSPQSIFSGQRMQQNPTITIPPRPANGSNFTFRPAPSAGNLAMNNTLQKLRELPEVKEAREEFMQAQKKYSEVMNRALKNQQGAVVSAAKTSPLTIQVPPAGSGSNGTAQVKVK